jgi:hypothetical protein
VHSTTSTGPGSKRHLLSARPQAGEEAHLMCDHLHDRDHLQHLWIATVICAVNIAIIIGVPFIIVQILVTIGLFGHDAITILAS